MNHPTEDPKVEQTQSTEYPGTIANILQRLTRVETQVEFLVKHSATKEDVANVRNWVLGSVVGGISLLLAILRFWTG